MFLQHTIQKHILKLMVISFRLWLLLSLLDHYMSLMTHAAYSTGCGLTDKSAGESSQPSVLGIH